MAVAKICKKGCEIINGFGCDGFIQQDVVWLDILVDSVGYVSVLDGGAGEHAKCTHPLNSPNSSVFGFIWCTW